MEALVAELLTLIEAQGVYQANPECVNEVCRLMAELRGLLKEPIAAKATANGNGKTSRT